MIYMLSIKEVAEKLGVSTDTIRRWEKKGLIRASRDANNYRIFNLEEVTRLNDKVKGTSKLSNNYRILKAPASVSIRSVDLFAGCGGTALGLENAGVEHVMLVERDRDAVATLRNNRPDWNVVCDDVEKVKFEVWNGAVDIVEGGFPCQAFSYAGKKMGFDDTRGTLFHEFARAIREIRPKIAIGENVRGLLSHDNGRTISVMVSTLQSLGYRVAYKVLRSQYFDVPQKRERLIIFALRNDLAAPILFPKERDYTISLRDAIGDLPQSEGQQYSKRKKEIMEQVPMGGYWRDLPTEIQKEYMGASYFMGGGKTGMARRLSWDEPSLTLTCNPAQKQTERCHPSETRPLSVREYARIQVFPDEWQFVGSVSSRYKQIGNAVPVNLGFHIGLAAIAMLTGQNHDDFEQVPEIPFCEVY